MCGVPYVKQGVRWRRRINWSGSSRGSFRRRPKGFWNKWIRR
jgi:hypothetical protein